MAFWIGWLCGLGTAVAHWLLWGRRRLCGRTPGVEKTGRRKHTLSRDWLETRNFLYYNGKEMPQVKEDKHGKIR